MSQPRKVVLPKVGMLKGGEAGRPASGIRITHVKSIKPPDAETLKKQKEEKLRAQLQKEIVTRSRQCANRTYECMLPIVSGRVYCARHILQDPTAPYKQCSHMYGSGERCTQPAPSDRGDHRDMGLCFTHARQSFQSRQRTAAQPPPVTTTETLLHQLQHYVKQERPRTTSCASSVSVVSDQAEQDPGIPSAVDPFKQIDATSVNSQYSATIMECASASDSDCDSVTLGPDGTCRNNRHSPIPEDAPCEDLPLWHAGVFTAEEAVSQAKEVLRLLQSAYIGQMGRLRTLLMMARSHYLKALKAEKEQYCSINSQARSGPLSVRERRQLRKLKAYAGYHRKHGVDALLARKQHHKRAKQGVETSNRPIPSLGRCTFTEGGVRCGNHVIPATKHCLKHILEDRHQVLFTACGDVRGCTSCREPAPRLPLPSSSCRYHTNPPVYTPFTLKKDDSDSETDSHSSSDESNDDQDYHSPEPKPDVQHEAQQE